MIYTVFKYFCYLFARLFFRFEAFKVERVPSRGGGILAVNHSSFLDPPLSGIAFKRPFYFFARKSLMKNALLVWIFKKLNCIPVDRDRLDTQTFRQVVQLIKKGKMIVMFPEGTRSASGQLQKGKEGTGMIIHHAKTRVIPCYISGASQALPRGASFPKFKKVRVIYGKPLDFSNFKIKGEKRAAYRQISNQVMEAIKALKQELESQD